MRGWGEEVGKRLMLNAKRLTLTHSPHLKPLSSTSKDSTWVTYLRGLALSASPHTRKRYTMFKSPKIKILSCRECSAPFHSVQKQRFCDVKCRMAWHNRQQRAKRVSNPSPKWQKKRVACKHLFIAYGFMLEYNTHIHVCEHCGVKKEGAL